MSGCGVTSKLRMSLPIPVECFQGSHHFLVMGNFGGFFGKGVGAGFEKGNGARVSTEAGSSGILGSCLVIWRVFGIAKCFEAGFGNDFGEVKCSGGGIAALQLGLGGEGRLWRGGGLRFTGWGWDTVTTKWL